MAIMVGIRLGHDVIKIGGGDFDTPTDHCMQNFVSVHDRVTVLVDHLESLGRVDALIKGGVLLTELVLPLISRPVIPVPHVAGEARL